jgi:hypothetical protein
MDHLVVADEIVEEGHDAEAVMPDLTVPGHEAAEEVPHVATDVTESGLCSSTRNVAHPSHSVMERGFLFHLKGCTLSGSTVK